jgi:hypothetical protein
MVKGNSVERAVSPAREPSGRVMGARPPVAFRCGSSSRSCGRVIGANGRPWRSNTAASSAALWPARRSRRIGIIQSRARTRSLLERSRSSASRSSKPNASQNRRPTAVSLTTARKICSPSFTVNTS